MGQNQAKVFSYPSHVQKNSSTSYRPQGRKHTQLKGDKKIHAPENCPIPAQKNIGRLKKKRAATRSVNHITDNINPRLEFLVKNSTLSSPALHKEISSYLNSSSLNMTLIKIKKT